MSVVIIGGNECMERQYRQICKTMGHSAKVYTKPTAALRGGFGRADLMILFTSTVVFPLPAPAMIKSGSLTVNTACRCISLRFL